jgi:hypothetical protein
MPLPLHADIADAVMLILGHEVINVGTIGIGEGGVLDDEDVFGVEFGTAGEVVRASDDGVIHDEHFVVHEVMRRVRTVWRRVFANEASVCDDVPDCADLPVVVGHVAPLHEHGLHLRAVVDARDLHPRANSADIIAEGGEESARAEEKVADTDPTTGAATT